MVSSEINFSTIVKAPVEKVFDAIATSDGMNSWFTAESVIEEKEGGNLLFHWKDWGVEKGEYKASGKVVEYNRPRRFVFEWNSSHDEDNFTRCEIDFKETPEGTLIELKDKGYGTETEKDEKHFLDCNTGWGQALTLLKFYVEHGVRY